MYFRVRHKVTLYILTWSVLLIIPLIHVSCALGHFAFVFFILWYRCDLLPLCHLLICASVSAFLFSRTCSICYVMAWFNYTIWKHFIWVLCHHSISVLRLCGLSPQHDVFTFLAIQSCWLAHVAHIWKLNGTNVFLS